MNQYKLYILFGEDATRALEEYTPETGVSVEEFISDRSGNCYDFAEKTFSTEGEMHAYIDGLEDCLGWEGYCFPSEKLNFD